MQWPRFILPVTTKLSNLSLGGATYFTNFFSLLGKLADRAIYMYMVIHNYGNPYKKWNIFVAWPHFWLKLGMVKLEIMLCETVLNLSTLRYLAISRHRARETVELLKMETPDFIPPRARM